MVLVMGHTGSGKSSLLRLINGLVPHHTGGILGGEIIVDGKSTRTTKPGELAGVVGIVGQNPIDTFVTDVVEDELAFGMESLNFPEDVMRKRIEEALDQVGLAPLRQRTIATLSGGEQQRLAIACALVMHPKVLLLDEPTRGIDVGAKGEIFDLLRERAEKGLAVLFVTSEISEAMNWSDRIVVMSRGHIVGIYKPSDVTREEIMSAAEATKEEGARV